MVEKIAKTLGILGGMGPASTSYFFDLLVKNTSAKNDEDHIPTLVYSNNLIPSRQEAIQSGNYSPVVESITNSLNLLINAGADFLVVPCNTAYFFIDQITDGISKPILHLIKESAVYFKNEQFINSNLKNNPRIGILATTGLVETKIYDKYFNELGFNLIYPTAMIQEQIHKIIFDIKAQILTLDGINKVKKIIQDFRQENDIEWVILACTELSVLFQNEDLESEQLFDPLNHIIKLCIDYARQKN